MSISCTYFFALDFYKVSLIIMIIILHYLRVVSTFILHIYLFSDAEDIPLNILHICRVVVSFLTFISV